MCFQRRAISIRKFAQLLVVVSLGSIVGGCGHFAGKPPLPRRASIEQGIAPSSRPDFVAVVAQAEVIYFPAERAASGASSEPSARLLEALRQHGLPFAIAWDWIDATQQPLLDALPGVTGRTREETIARLELAGTGRAREHCRAVLRDPRLVGLRHLALRCPPGELVKIAEGRGFEEGKDYHEMFIAGKIIAHFQALGAPEKLLVFLRGRELARGRVPFFVAQKLPVRQMVLDSSEATPLRARLFARRD